MLLTPHRVIRRFEEENVDSATMVVNGIGYGFGEFLDVQLTPTTSDAAFRSHGVETSRPYFLLWTGPESDFPLGTLIEDCHGNFYKVSAPPMNHEFGNAADHCDTVAERMQYEPSSVERRAEDACWPADGSSGSGSSSRSLGTGGPA